MLFIELIYVFELQVYVIQNGLWARASLHRLGIVIYSKRTCVLVDIFRAYDAKLPDTRVDGKQETKTEQGDDSALLSTCTTQFSAYISFLSSYVLNLKWFFFFVVSFLLLNQKSKISGRSISGARAATEQHPGMCLVPTICRYINIYVWLSVRVELRANSFAKRQPLLGRVFELDSESCRSCFIYSYYATVTYKIKSNLLQNSWPRTCLKWIFV